ncbi:MAG: extracellular solute-binding protein [Spirochaetaceae bacterium]|nr:extracellular solute-binding protein [Spirochaetaceae bacterium]
MKKISKVLAIGLSALILLAGMALVFTGCQKKEAAPAAAVGSTADYDFFIFNTKGENADAMQAAVNAYQTKTGLKIKLFSLGSGTNSDDALRADMTSRNPPAIFCVMNPQALKEWVEGDFATDFATATNLDPTFKTLADNVDKNLWLTTDGNTNYGIPFNVEGYGYIVDKEMIAALFGAGNVDGVLAGLTACGWDDFKAFVEAVDAYIKNGTAGNVTLAGKSFALASSKTGKAASLKAVFSMAGSEKWTYGDHLVNIACDAVFPNVAAAVAATDAQVDSMKGAFIAYAKCLDLMSSHSISPRGPEFINSTTNGYDACVNNFANSETLFIKQGNWVYTNIEKANAAICPTLTFVPIKMPFQQSDIKVPGLTVEKLITSIPVFVPNYYLINKKVDVKVQQEAEKFLVWLNTDPEGQKFVTKDMAFIPYNADPAATKLGNSLGDSIISYMAKGATITNAYAGAPVSWSGDTFGLKIMESYLTKATWTEQDYSDIADYGIQMWKQMKNQ